MEFVCFKLVSGEEIFAALTEFRDPGCRVIEVMFPMELIRDVQVDDYGRSQKIVKLIPYFPFASDRIFKLNASSIQHLNPLAEGLIKTYKDCVEAYNKAEETSPPEASPVKVDVNVDESDDYSDSFYVPGNDTLN